MVIFRELSAESGRDLKRSYLLEVRHHLLHPMHSDGGQEEPSFFVSFVTQEVVSCLQRSELAALSAALESDVCGGTTRRVDEIQGSK